MQKRGSLTFLVKIKNSCSQGVENYPDFEKLSHVIQPGLQGVIVENVECESMEANYLIVTFCRSESVA